MDMGVAVNRIGNTVDFVTEPFFFRLCSNTNTLLKCGCNLAYRYELCTQNRADAYKNVFLSKTQFQRTRKLFLDHLVFYLQEVSRKCA